MVTPRHPICLSSPASIALRRPHAAGSDGTRRREAAESLAAPLFRPRLTRFSLFDDIDAWHAEAAASASARAETGHLTGSSAAQRLTRSRRRMAAHLTQICADPVEVNLWHDILNDHPAEAEADTAPPLARGVEDDLRAARVRRVLRDAPAAAANRTGLPQRLAAASVAAAAVLLTALKFPPVNG